MLLKVYETIARWFKKSSWILTTIAIICFATPVIVALTSEEGAGALGPLLALPGIGVFIWGITICISWFHPESGSMRIDDEDTASNFRMISRSISTLFMALYFLTGIALAALPLTA
ncbi:MAG: hypothetical protein AAGG11_07385 [Pseudomonadota bacterium]